MTPLIAPADVPYLPRGVRLDTDRVRGIRVLQAPERAMQLDAIGDAILSELDGARSMGAIVSTLATRYNAPEDQIAGDVRDFLTGLIERRMVFLRGAA
jgi:pyrroloquinoline quinone biosynthesis protein D